MQEKYTLKYPTLTIQQNTKVSMEIFNIEIFLLPNANNTFH